MTVRGDWAAMLAWLSVCVDTDEQVAQTLHRDNGELGEWFRGDRTAWGGGTDVWDLNVRSSVPDRGFYKLAEHLDREVADHMARHDPERALAEVAAKRAMLADWQQQRDKVAEFYNRPDAELHADFAHPGYEYKTTEGQRKAWDHSDEPPWGDDGPDHTWERNVDAGRDGWERFEYTEESYWRRLLPEDKRGTREPEPPRHIRHMVTAYQHEPGYRPEWAPEAHHG